MFDKPQCLPPALRFTGQIKEPSLQPYFTQTYIMLSSWMDSSSRKLFPLAAVVQRVLPKQVSNLSNKDCWKSRGHSNWRVRYFYWPLSPLHWLGKSIFSTHRNGMCCKLPWDCDMPAAHTYTILRICHMLWALNCTIKLHVFLRLQSIMWFRLWMQFVSYFTD